MKVKRSDFDDFGPVTREYREVTGYDVTVQRNYQCHGKYGPDQVVELLDWIVTVWKGRNCLSGSAPSAETVGAEITRLKAEIDAMCPHEEMRELDVAEARDEGVTHFGSCFHVYKCRTCGEVQCVDSSG